MSPRGRYLRGAPSAISIAVIPKDHKSLWKRGKAHAHASMQSTKDKLVTPGNCFRTACGKAVHSVLSLQTYFAHWALKQKRPRSLSLTVPLTVPDVCGEFLFFFFKCMKNDYKVLKINLSQKFIYCLNHCCYSTVFHSYQGMTVI